MKKVTDPENASPVILVRFEDAIINEIKGFIDQIQEFYENTIRIRKCNLLNAKQVGNITRVQKELINIIFQFRKTLADLSVEELIAREERLFDSMDTIELRVYEMMELVENELLFVDHMETSQHFDRDLWDETEGKYLFQEFTTFQPRLLKRLLVPKTVDYGRTASNSRLNFRRYEKLFSLDHQAVFIF